MSAQPSTLTIGYDAAAKSYRITTAGKTQTFLPSDIDKASSNAGATVYNKVNGNVTDTLTLTNPGTSGHFTYQYVGSGYWQQINQTSSNIAGTLDAFTYGIVTPDSALPRTGGAQYAIDILAEVASGNSGVVATAGSGTLGVDFQSGNILAKATMPAVILSGSTDVTIAAKLSGSTGGFTGSIIWNDFGAFIGTINGRFYGPNGQEVGGAFSAAQTGVETIAAGTIIGRGGAPSAIDPTQSNPSASGFFFTDTAGFSTSESGQDGFNATGGFSNGKTNSGQQEFYSANGSGYLALAGAGLPTGQPNLIGAASTAPQQQQSFGFGSGIAGAIPKLSYVSAGEVFQQGSSANYSLFGNDTLASAMPRTGSAGYDIVASVKIADPAYPNTVFGDGLGSMVVNLATGAISGGGAFNYRENYTLVPPAPQPPFPAARGGFTLSGKNSSTTNGFTGIFLFDTVGNYSGAMTGRYYGPTAQEVGAVFSASASNGGVAAGEFIGVKDPAITQAETGLLELTTPTIFPITAEYLKYGNGGNWVVDTNETLAYDPSTKTYTFTVNDRGTPVRTTTFNSASLDSSTSNAGLSVFNVSGSDQTSKIILFNPGPSNTTLALSYVSFVDVQYAFSNGVGGTFNEQYYAPFGVATPAVSVPKSGTGSYTGVIYGSATQTPATGPGVQYALSGSSALAADFSAATIATTLNFTGTPIGGGATADLGSVTMNGSIGRDAAGNSLFTGRVYGGGTNATFNDGTVQGAFYGPAANEFGLSFSNSQGLAGTYSSTQTQGVSVGKKN